MESRLETKSAPLHSPLTPAKWVMWKEKAGQTWRGSYLWVTSVMLQITEKKGNKIRVSIFLFPEVLWWVSQYYVSFIRHPRGHLFFFFLSNVLCVFLSQICFSHKTATLCPTTPFQTVGKQKKSREKCFCQSSEPALRIFPEDPPNYFLLHWPELSHMTHLQGRLGNVVP